MKFLSKLFGWKKEFLALNLNNLQEESSDAWMFTADDLTFTQTFSLGKYDRSVW